MIQIDDNDMPIVVAEKIIRATKWCKATPIDKAIQKATMIAFNGEYKELDTESIERDMFSLEEIKEIADYLMIYYNSHEQGD